MTTRVTINGAALDCDGPPDTPLIFALRNDLNLKGTRSGCGSGECGACTVLVDGAPRQSCTLQLSDVAGRSIETVESLRGGSPTDNDAPLLEAFLAEQAGQCGYCLSGILMRATALLRDNPSPTRKDVAEALDGNLCRCGAQNRMLKAVRRAASAAGGAAAQTAGGAS